MDKSWIDLRDVDPGAYGKGVEKFLEFAFLKRNPGDSIYCPCNVCANRHFRDRATVNNHLVLDGFLKTYKFWNRHGEVSNNNNSKPLNDDMVIDGNVADCGPESESNMGVSMAEMVREGFGIPQRDENVTNDHFDSETEIPDEVARKFFQLLKDAETEVYPDCKEYTKLSFIVELMHIKVLNGITNKGITMILEFMKKVWPYSNIPSSYYQANKITTDLGFTYETYDVCPNSCMLFRNETADLEKCELCHASRYKENGDGLGNEDGQPKGKRIAEKKVRYFPLKPRMQRLFWSSKTAPLMKWHKEERIDDGIMRHPADSRAWKHLDEKNPTFASEPRNVRLGLATDGFNPFGNMSIAHSTWPVVLIPYNLPPWVCMKQPSFIVSMIIDGKKGPGTKIDVYLQLLIEELKELWNDGILTYDISTKKMFQLRAALLWTINDFPALGDMWGWVTKGEFACPLCNLKPNSLWLKHSGKWCYGDNRRFLPKRHKYRKDRYSFILQKVEMKEKPPFLTGEKQLQQLKDFGVETVYKKEDVLRKRKREEFERQQQRITKEAPKRKHNYTKLSIFFELPYWKDNLIRHNLDVMHIEKNVCDNVLFTLLGVKGKTKDHLKGRKDLQEMNIRPGLHPTTKGANLQYVPPAEFTMTKEEKDLFLKVLKDVKVPDGYSSNISRCVNLEGRTIFGLKSHDSHILMQQLLPIALRRVLPPDVVKALIELGSCFRQLCSKVNSLSDIEKLQDRMAITISTLEAIFTPSFFNVMEHLPVHLPDELLIAGSVYFRWMYPIERYLSTLKDYVRNYAHPEASIAKGVLVQECMTFCSRYLGDQVETKSNRPLRNDDGGNICGRPAGKTEKFNLDEITREQAHRYVLANAEAIQPFINTHLEELRELYPRDPRQVDKIHHESFPTWFRNHVHNITSSGLQVSKEILNLSMGRKKDASRFKGYIVNGFRFRRKDIDIRRNTQNSGVMLTAKTMSYASSRDRNPREGIVTYYGQLTDIIEIRYTNKMKFVLFRCDWINNQIGLKVDALKFTLVNFNHLLYNNNIPSNEPFILAGQADQVWYVQDPKDTDWHVAVPMVVRDKFDMYSTDDSLQSTSIPQVQPFDMQELDQGGTNQPPNTRSWVREGIDGETIDTSLHDVDQDDTELDLED